MQNSAQEAMLAGRFLGFVRVTVGGRTFNLPVEALPFAPTDGADCAAERGGFFIEKDERIGIVVDLSATTEEMQAQIAQGAQDAVRHLSQKFLN